MNIELIYSPDDAENEGKGYYFQKWIGGGKTKTSQLFANEDEAQSALTQNKIKWN